MGRPRLVIENTDHSWHTDAACLGAGPALWFPAKTDRFSQEAAKAVCRQCSVTEACLAFALNNVITHGIWGGLSEKQRRRMRIARRRRLQVTTITEEAS